MDLNVCMHFWYIRCSKIYYNWQNLWLHRVFPKKIIILKRISPPLLPFVSFKRLSHYGQSVYHVCMRSMSKFDNQISTNIKHSFLGHIFKGGNRRFNITIYLISFYYPRARECTVNVKERRFHFTFKTIYFWTTSSY